MNVIEKLVSAFCVAFAGVGLMADSTTVPKPPVVEKDYTANEQKAISNTIAQINHINWVVNIIKTYKDPVVLEVESEKVSQGNLYLDRIPDKAAMERIKQILITLHNLRIDEREVKKWREDFEERRDRERKTFLLKASKQAVDAMTKQVQECCSSWSWEDNPVGSIAAVVNTVFNLVHCPVSLYNDYDNFVFSQNKAVKDRQFDFDTAKLNLLHQQNIELLEDQWNFINYYKLDDKLRVSDADINKLLDCLRDDDPSRIYTRLVPMRERFSLFPEYWYYLSCVAMETGHFKEGLEACDRFFNVNRHIFRDDPMEGTVAFNKAFMLPKTDAHKQEIRRCLELASKNNVLRGDWQLDYLVAIMYKGVFGEHGKSETLLEQAKATIEQAMLKRARYGCRASVTLKEGLRNCRNALHELRGEPTEEFEVESEERKEEIIASIKTSQSKKELTEFQLAETGVTLKIPYDKHLLDFDKFSLKMMRNNECVQEVRAYTGNDENKWSDVALNGNFLKLYFPTATKPLEFDAFRLLYNDPNCPVEWTIVEDGEVRSKRKMIDASLHVLGILDPNPVNVLGYEAAGKGVEEFVRKFKFRSVIIDGKEYMFDSMSILFAMNDVGRRASVP